MSQSTQPAAEAEMSKQNADSSTLTQWVRPFVIMVLGIGSLLLAIAQLTWPEDAQAFVTGNHAALPIRLAIIGTAWAVAVVVSAGALALTLRSREPARLRDSMASLSAPFVVSCFVPVLFWQEAWQGREIAFLALLFGIGLGLERLLPPGLALMGDWATRFPRITDRFTRVRGTLPGRLMRWIPLAITVALAGFYIYRIGHLTNISHMKFNTMSSDLAEYDNLFFNALHGHPFRAPAIAGDLKDWSNLQAHAEFGLYLLLPIYALSPGAPILLWIQSSLVGLTAIPLYLLGAARLGRLAGVAFAFAFLAMPAVQQPNFYDFHFTPLSMFFVAWLLFFVFKLSQEPTSRRYRIAVASAVVLALACREDISIGITVLGFFLLLRGVLAREGLILMLAGASYFATLKFAVMPLFGNWWFDAMYQDLKADGAKGYGAVVLTLLSNPPFTLRTMLTEPKLLYVLHMTVPLLALWLRKPLLWMAVLPGFVSTLLVTNRPPMHQISFQYTYLWLPYVFGASIVATRHGVRGVSTLASLLLVAFAASHQFGVYPRGERIQGGFILKNFEFGEKEAKQYADLQELIAMMPPDAIVSVTETEGPHVSTRLVMYSLKYTLGADPEYLLVGHAHHGGERHHIRQALESGNYGVIAQRGRFILAKRGADTRDNAVLWQRIGGRGRRR